MEKSWLKKGLVFGIIVLFVGMGVRLVISGDIATTRRSEEVPTTNSITLNASIVQVCYENGKGFNKWDLNENAKSKSESIGSSDTQDISVKSTPSFNRGSILYVGGTGPNNYSKIQDAVDNASNSDIIYVYIGLYIEKITVNKNLYFIGENKNSTIIQGAESGNCITISQAKDTFSDFTIQGALNYGISASYTDLNLNNVTITECNGYGIYSTYSSNLTLIDCTISDNGGGVQWVYSSSSPSKNVYIQRCAIKNNTGHGVFLSLPQGSNIIITNTSIVNNSGSSTYGIYCSFAGYKGSVYLDTVDVIDNDGYAIDLIGANNIVFHDVVIDNAGNGLELSHCTDITIVPPFTIHNTLNYGISASYTDLNLNNVTITECNGYGIYSTYSSNLTLIDCTISDNGGGVQWVYSSSSPSKNVYIQRCAIKNNTGHGVFLSLPQGSNIIITNTSIVNNSGSSTYGIYCSFVDSSGMFIIEKNTIFNSRYGIYMNNINNGFISCNSVLNNYYDGIYLTNCDNNTIYDNNISSNNRFGIYLYNSNNNNIDYNDFLNNLDYSINIIGSASNSIKLNNFNGNNYGDVQASDSSTNNRWNGTALGNYWSDYTSRYPNATNNGAIWDTPYDIDGNSGSADYKPLVFPITNLPPVFGAPTPTNGSTNQPLSFTWSIPITDSEGDLFSWTIQCNNGQTSSATGATNGTKTLSLSGLSYSKTYKVWVNATDLGGSGLYTRKWYTFTTKASLPPVFGTPTPANGSTNQPLSFTWNISINDPEGDTFSWSIQCSNGQANSGTSAANGTKTLALSGLAYSTTYKIWVNATDPTGSGLYTRKWFTFTTQQQQNSPPNKPNKPSGETNGKINTPYTYSTSTTDPNGDQVYYQWDWGDGTQSNWLGPYNSGATVSTTHTWGKGSYSIKVKAKDSNGAESNWSDPLTITMPKNSALIPYFALIQMLKQFFERFPHVFPILRHLLGY
jgi:parallel beta-helix repeat protein